MKKTSILILSFVFITSCGLEKNNLVPIKKDDVATQEQLQTLQQNISIEDLSNNKIEPSIIKENVKETPIAKPITTPSAIPNTITYTTIKPDAPLPFYTPVETSIPSPTTTPTSTPTPSSIPTQTPSPVVTPSPSATPSNNVYVNNNVNVNITNNQSNNPQPSATPLPSTPSLATTPTPNPTPSNMSTIIPNPNPTSNPSTMPTTPSSSITPSPSPLSTPTALPVDDFISKIPEAPVNIYKFDSNLKESFSNLYDGHSNNINFITDNMGKKANAYYFDGTTNNKITFSNSKIVSNTFTLSLWINPEKDINIDVESTTITSGTSGQNYLFFPTHGGEFGNNIVGVGLSIGKNGIGVYEHKNDYLPALLFHKHTFVGWTHIVIIYDNKKPSLYINGEFIKSGLQSPSDKVNFSLQYSGIGGGMYGNYVGGADNIVLYDRILNNQEVLKLYYAK